ncbi:hypothetical protein SAMN05444007_105264 [Cribrihabitans marinus]|uniref:Peptidase family S41 n=1 Tax=Cribrihabitans marinus TaxID=1227549 RepID=A0A1H6ZUR0_9RHOB|nr:peptidase S41 [Cribrihabitans marinus]GGH29951.1 hypothetical protein GCM10010973_19770 [Cribrihabitans marinus]SEJ57071.1 hypothetical protein SAMN05444007_105264 [Cribrihabitans marinus]
MSLSQDLKPILDIVERVDPSFATVDPETIASLVEDARSHASQNAKDQFLFSVMRLLALSGNGHTRLIPNDAISVLPLRFVTIGRSVFLTKTLSPNVECAPHKLIAVNDSPVDRIERAGACLLAGTRQRQRVIGPLLLAWPAALAHLGFASTGDETSYQLQSADGRITSVKVPNAKTVPASEMYPRNEHGQVDPVWQFDGYVKVHECTDNGLALRLPSFFDPDESAYPEAIDRAATLVQSRQGSFLVIDVRGNTGGDFLRAMPLIYAITESARESGCAVLVDKFTFSAAIVFVAILKYRLGHKLRIVGEEMGDCLKFFAEGGLIELPTSGAVVRYSSALHDWESGSTDQTTPPEIARQIVPVRRLEVDRYWVSTPFDTTPRDMVYNRLIEDLT